MIQHMYMSVLKSNTSNHSQQILGTRLQKGKMVVDVCVLAKSKRGCGQDRHGGEEEFKKIVWG